MKAILSLCMVLALLTGCKTFDVGKADPAAIQAAKIGVQYATMKVVSKVDEADRPARAARIRAIVTDIESTLTGEAVSLSILDVEIRRHLPQNLKPEDQLAVNSLIQLVMVELKAQVGEGLLNENQLVQVKMVAEWVVEACGYYS